MLNNNFQASDSVLIIPKDNRKNISKIDFAYIPSPNMKQVHPKSQISFVPSKDQKVNKKFLTTIAKNMRYDNINGIFDMVTQNQQKHDLLPGQKSDGIKTSLFGY
ncbi:hypothetical protein SS50377_21903 [Spironucleus salmonicida]|uniref:Uncharacterized protein n=1 Tax=Spironucleus salmonicida TaxID=348837 RepID=V6LUF8_9EUKA|nr:hypothetical protein SS50377_21903 [Spironucleus salmonicida]|eukprot:EST44444.1 Hypothetical protein SS50377_15752 [Spironucleus salmonicida]